jgi:hypothetical protein
MECVLFSAVGPVFHHKLLTLTVGGVFGVLTSLTPVAGVESEPRYQCSIGSPTIPLDLLVTRPVEDSSSARGIAAAFGGGLGPVRGYGKTGDQAWFLVGDPETRDSLSYVTVSLSASAVTNSGLCLLRTVDLEGQRSASLALAAKPKRTAKTIDLWVKSFNCGESGKVTIDKVENNTSVRLTAFVAQTSPKGITPNCLETPARRYRVALVSKLGSRSLLDSTQYPHRPMRTHGPNGPWNP